jgi:hypothetical protein
MPETPVNEHDRLVPPQNQIRRSRQRFIVQPKPQTTPMQEATNN